jgi:hypothetical protein
MWGAADKAVLNSVADFFNWTNITEYAQDDHSFSNIGPMKTFSQKKVIMYNKP